MSVRSGAVIWTTSVPARPETASLATSATSASPSVPGGSTGSARCTSNRSWAIDQTAWWRCTSATAIRAAVRLAASSSTAGALAARAAANRATCSCTADSACTSRCTVCASQAASRCAAVGSSAPVRPAMVRRASLLVRRVFCPACWCSSHSVRLLGGLPCLLAYSLRKLLQLPSDRHGAGAEQVHHVLADPADLGAVAVGPRHHGVPERGQPGLQGPVGDWGDGEPLVVQGPRVQGAPFVVGAVAALHPIPDRDVYVQLRVTVARQVVQEQAGDQARPRPATPPYGPNGARCGCRSRAGPASPPPSRAASISASSISPARASSAAARVLVAVLAGLAGRDPVRGVQHRYALDRTDGQVEVRHLMRVLAALGRADLGQLDGAGVRVRGQVRRHRGLLPAPRPPWAGGA